LLSPSTCTYYRAQCLARTFDTLAVQIGIDWPIFEVSLAHDSFAEDTAKVTSPAAARLPIHTRARPGLGAC